MRAFVLLTALLLNASIPLVAADHGGDHELVCRIDPAFARIASFTSNSATFQVAGNTATVPVPAGQALVFSLDGGFWVDVDYHCLEALQVRVFKDGVLTQDHFYNLNCGTGTHQEWVPMGLETSEVLVQINWWGCDGTRGGARGSGTAGDPPVFTPEGELRPVL